MIRANGLQEGTIKEENSRIARFRPGRRSFIVFFLIFLSPLILYLFIAITKDVSAWKVVLLIAGIVLAFYFWIFLHIIDIYPNRISYYSLIGGRRTLYFNEVEWWSIRVGVFKYMDRFKPTVRFEIEPYVDTGKKPIIIAIKLFRKEDIDTVLNLLPADKEARK